MRCALVLSPHLDDAAFSCGGTMALLADAGWDVALVTLFTRSVPNPTGFALACQLDKGLGPEVDYMALRRAEDAAAARHLGVRDLRWLSFAEAPHRGYDSAPALFAGPRPGDDAWRDLVPAIAALLRELEPRLVLAPQGLGNHVDHLQVIRALGHAAPDAAPDAPIAYYRDAPYAFRNQGAAPVPSLAGLPEATVPVAAGLERKVAAAQAYASQLGFQFGGPEAAGTALRRFADAEGRGVAAERFRGAVPFAAGSQ